jgi:hypothetical protein
MAAHSGSSEAGRAPSAACVVCPACGSAETESVHALSGIPTQSATLVATTAEAAGFPLGDLTLRWCGGCGLAFNAAFDPAQVEYGIGYEESQAASPTFQRFARELSARWIERYGLAGRRAVEIGCGKGEFLSLFCTLSGGNGLGIDPAWRPDRTPASDRVRFEARRFDERDVPLDADVIICRHTLEHIGDVAAFVRLLRAACGARRPVVAVEVPDFRRILAELAFWDVYYEHAVYFTAGSLGRLFRWAGFDVLAIDRVFGDQYLVLEAVPARVTGSGLPPIADDLAETAAGVARFRESCAAAITGWRKRFQAWRQDDRNVVVWGSGSKAVGFLTSIGDVAQVRAVVDINPARQGRFMPGCAAPIIAPAQLTALAPDVVIIMNPIYRREIACELQALGLRPELFTVDAAQEAHR